MDFEERYDAKASIFAVHWLVFGFLEIYSFLVSLMLVSVWVLAGNNF